MTQSRNALSARSVIASTLLGMQRPVLRGSVLVRWCEQLGIAGGTARVALSRMVASGELRADDGHYELTGRLRAKQTVQRFTRVPELTAWDGMWRAAMVVGAEGRAPAERAALRTAMHTLRMAERREGVWMRPANLPDAAQPEDALDAVRAQCELYSLRPDGDARSLATELFDLDAWAERARDHLAAMRGRDTSLGERFTTAAVALATIRSDPLLPEALLPEDWPGQQLRTRYDAYESAFRAAWRDWYRTTTDTL